MNKYLASYIVFATCIGMGSDTVLAQSFDLPPDVNVGETMAPESMQEGSPNATVMSTELALRGFRSETISGDSSHSARASAHLFGRHKLNEDLGILFNVRLRAFDAEGSNFTFQDSFQVDIQELALAWTAAPNLSFQLGRINIRNGVSSGYNPTDWFKADSKIDSDSLDPSDLRKERLGVLAITGTTTLGNALVQGGYRPKITAGRGSVLTDHDVVGLGLDRTNSTHAYFLKFTPNLGGNISGTANLLVDDGKLGAGFEVSGTLGDNLVVYSEVFAQDGLSLAADALQNGLGDAAFRSALGADSGPDWYTKASVGGTWSVPQSFVGSRDISISLEYHHNGAGLNGYQINTLASASGANLLAAGSLRDFAADQQEPLARNQFFTRFAWNDFWNDADFSMLGFYASSDDSGLLQLSAEFPLNDSISIDVRAISTFGESTSVYGAIPTRRSVQMGVTYVF